MKAQEQHIMINSKKKVWKEVSHDELSLFKEAVSSLLEEVLKWTMEGIVRMLRIKLSTI